MKKLLYIGHDFHNKTKSTQFLQDLFAEKYKVEKFNFDPYNEDFSKFKQLKGKNYDVVILFQIMPSIKLLKKYIHWEHIAFFPMYDDSRDLDYPRWYEYKLCNIINFSRTLHKKCIDYGFSSYYIQYFPEPVQIENWGDEKSIFFWQRVEQINPNVIEKLLNVKDINNLYLHDVPDPNQKSIEPSVNWDNKVIKSHWFDTKEDLINYIQKSAIYIAPREYEGFGNSYLDAMAQGRCVLAVNNPAMNEYIVDNYNGYLFDLNNLKHINLKNIRKIQENAYNYIKEGRIKWLKEKSKILDWIEFDPKIDNVKLIQKYFSIKKIIKTIFSITNSNCHKVITVLGIKVCIKK